MLALQPATLEAWDVRLEPLQAPHVEGLRAAAADGELWTLWYTSVPAPQETDAYVASALTGQADGHTLPWVVRDLQTDAIVGCTRFCNVVPSAHRVEIGYTWYAARAQRTRINTACKWLLLRHAFETLRCGVVSFQTDAQNARSQRAIERLGAKRDGVIRQAVARRDGSVRDSVVYSIIATEWPAVERALHQAATRLAQRDGVR